MLGHMGIRPIIANSTPIMHVFFTELRKTCPKIYSRVSLHMLEILTFLHVIKYHFISPER